MLMFVVLKDEISFYHVQKKKSTISIVKKFQIHKVDVASLEN